MQSRKESRVVNGGSGIMMRTQGWNQWSNTSKCKCIIKGQKEKEIDSPEM